MFEVFEDKSRLEGTNYVELHPREIPQQYACWLDGSAFIRDAGFDFFAECFYKTVPGFDYFSFTRVTGPHLVALGQEIRLFTSSCREVSDRRLLFSRYASLFSTNIWDEVPDELLRTSLIKAGGMIEDVRARAELTSGVLWVLGM